jgi:hypothetical protein
MKRLAFLAAVACLCGGAPPGTGRVEAGFIPAVDFTNGTGVTYFGDQTFGYSFTTGATPLTIDALGLLSATTPNGQMVRIYQDGTTTNLRSVEIPSNAPVSSSMNGHTYSYEGITLLTLLPNTTYDIVVDLPAGELDQSAAATVNNPDITFGAGRAQLGLGAFPTGDGFSSGPYFGPTFDVGTSLATPEPASLTLLGIGAAGLLAYGGRRRRATA